MVFFTCNHCGESAKKPAVEKHYNTKCRGAPIFISCMDCQKDFRDQEYVEHTKCVSEAEKYSGKGYVPKESLNKGQKKQDSWLEIVRSILTTTEYNLNPAVKTIFQRLQSYDNVPRKGSKFENFVSNSMRINKNQAKEVWKILEMELNKLKKSINVNSNTTNGNVKESNGHTENGDVTKLTTEPIESTDDNKPKKNKKSKKRSLEDNKSIEVNNVSMDTEITEEPKKKKKKSKNGQILEETELNPPPIELINSAIDNEISEEPKKKKNKSKSGQIVEETDVNNSVMDKEIPEEPKKKSKNESIVVETGMLKEIKTNGKTNIGKDGTFNWFNVILECAKDGISVDKLKKKVIKKHESIVGHNESTNLNKLEKTFKKYLKKSGITIDNDIIKIIG